MTSHRGNRTSTHRIGAVALTLVLLSSLLSACQKDPNAPPPVADGHDLGLITRSVPSTLAPGRENDFTVRVANFGTATATNTKFAVVAPSALTLDASVGGTSCDDDGSTSQGDFYVICDLGDLAPNASATIDLEAWAGDWTNPSDITYAALADHDEPSPDPHPNTVTIPTSVAAPAFDVPTVAITTPAADASTTADATIDYAGTATDDVDGDLSASIVWSIVPAARPRAVPITLGSGASGTLGPLAEGIYVLIAEITNSAGQTAQATSVIDVGPAVRDGRDLGIDTTGMSTTLTIGTPLTTTLAVHDYGTATATATQLVIAAPDALALTATTSDAATCPATVGSSTTVITCDLGDIAAAAQTTVTLHPVAAPGNPPATVDFTVTSNGFEPDPDPHSNVATIQYTSRYASPPTLAITSPGTTDTVSVASGVAVPYAATAATATGADRSGDITWTYQNNATPDADPVSLPSGASGTLGPLDPGSYTLTAHVDDGAGQDTTVSRTVTTHTPIVNTSSGLAVLMPDAPTTVPAGVTTTFPITIHNFGPTTVTGAALDFTSSAAMHPLFAKNWWDSHGSLGAGGDEKYAIGLAAGASVTYLVKVTPDAGTTSATLTATLKKSTTNPGNPNPVTVDSISTPVTVTDPNPAAPTLTITAPQARNSDFSTTADLTTTYSATATDPTDGDLSDQVDWTLTPLDDPLETVADLGTGASGSLSPLQPGIYVLRATVTDSAGRSATSAVVVTVVPTNMSCQTVVSFRPVSGLYLPQIMSAMAGRTYDTCGRQLQFTWDAVYTAVSDTNLANFNATMNDDAHDVVGGDFTLQAPDEWIITLDVCVPALGSIPASCAQQVARDYASADPTAY